MIKKLLSVAIILLLSACSTLQNELKNFMALPEVNYKSISVGKVSTNRIELDPVFNITNKSNFSMPIDAVSYEFFLNNKKMLSGKTKQIGTIAPNENKDVSLSLVLTKKTLLSLQQLLSKYKQLDYQIKGKVNAIGLTIPFEKSATLYIPEIKVRGLEVINASFTQLDIVLSIDIENKNAFGLPLEDINYSVSSQGKTLFKGGLNKQKIVQGTNNIQLPLTIKPDELFSNVFTLLQDPELPLQFNISTPLFNKTYEHTLNLSSFFLLTKGNNRMFFL